MMDSSCMLSQDTVDGPFKADATTCIIYYWARMRINMKEYTAKAPCLLVMLSDLLYEA